MSGSTNGGRARAYEALRDSEELHRATLSSISDAVFLTDDEGVFTYICPNVDMIFGYVPDEVQAMTHISRLLGENLFDRAELAARGEIHNIEREITSKAGERRTVLVLLKAVSIKGGTVLYSCRDVTERKRAEEDLRAARLDLAHASRLALCGEMMAATGGVEFDREWHGRDGANRRGSAAVGRANSPARGCRGDCGERHRPRYSSRPPAQAFRRVLHDEERRHGPGPRHRAIDRRGAQRTDLGRGRRRARGDLSADGPSIRVVCDRGAARFRLELNPTIV
jgi:PAS domain S-box-containing protein